MRDMSTAERVPLTRGRIIAAAVDFVDEHGLEALSMRKLGAALGVEAMSLYNHVDNKDDVLDGILDAVLRQVRVPDQRLPWRERLADLLRGFRIMGLTHPGVLPMFGSRPIASVEAFVPIAAIHEILRDAGFDGDRAIDAFMIVSSFILGYMQIDLGRMSMNEMGRITDYESWAVDGHGGAVELGVGLVARDWDKEFDRCLELMADGIHALLDDGAVPD